MDEDSLPNLRRYILGNKRNILILSILVLATGLFFSALTERIAEAKEQKTEAADDLCDLDPMSRIKKDAGKSGEIWLEYCEKKKEEGSGMSEAEKIRREKYMRLVGGYPIEEMVPFISQNDERVAAFLIGIAKKESDWGKHSPKKNGRNCFNYWGYKGGYNPTESGYSCFDSPEQAIKEVGGRLGKLLVQRVDTPERMIVWKCGSSCAGHDPGSVKKWISDVRTYYEKVI